VKPEKVFLEINWNLLTFFAGLFVVVGAGVRPASPIASSRSCTRARRTPPLPCPW